MRDALWKYTARWSALVAAALLGPTTSSAHGQWGGPWRSDGAIAQWLAPGRVMPPPYPAMQYPGWSEPVATLPMTALPGVQPPLTPQGPLRGEEDAGAETHVSLINSAITASQLRVRWDFAYNNRRPDRAEFFYAKCGCFRLAGRDPSAGGPEHPEKSVDYQDFATYLELAVSSSVSGFIEMPFRWINPEANDNTGGFADMNLGFKWAFYQAHDTVATFQFRTYIPSGDADRGLGTDHASLEPAILAYHRFADRFSLECEALMWFPLDGTDFAGEMIRYGAGLSYDLFHGSTWRITPVAEFIGWTVLDGQALVVHSFSPLRTSVEEAEGDTIVNGLFGVRFGWGDVGDVYTGYGRPLTGDRWYESIFRLEMRLFF